MECLEAKALKSSFHWELAMKSSTQQEILEEVLCVNGANVVPGEDFEVDEFFNFSNGDLEFGSALQVEDDDDEEDEEEEEEEEEEDEEEEERDRLSVSSEERVEDDGSSYSNQSGGLLAVDDSDSLLSVELAIPGDALADLEWVSHFVDDSCSEFTFLSPAVKETFTNNRSEPERQLSVTEISCFPSAFPVRPRTKRPRQSRPAKSLGSSLTQSPSSSSSSSNSTGISSAPCFIFPVTSENDDSFNAPGEPPKKQRKTAAHQSGSASTAQFQRRCSHCLVQKTPQWRTGPNGAKTLCNACGVRFKSGRLFPEYRPALSPTFCREIHSNSHRKVLEMRKVKENVEPTVRVDSNGSELLKDEPSRTG